MTVRISVSRIHFPVTTLGPGRRLGIWFQGCSIRCPGCISMDTWVEGRGNTTVEEVVNSIIPWISKADGITISGGEPFDQPDALLDLTTRIRSKTEADILVFTGYPWMHIRNTVGTPPATIDALVTGPFEFEKTQTLALRGSDNQELHFITEKGRARFASFERLADERDRSVDVMFDENGDVWFAGIPARNDFRRLQELLESNGSTLDTSEDKRIPSMRARPA
ncbi:anaerobic ribonucleoside-triphosphate reductase activating protein [Bradyrhizobium sp. AZCC 1719]|uniref:4Fe-4S single cluster domain-containing protein n=1 Tax=Bradyrhizobium sp. AZCC 1719 TaxID=3117028 RepID=UPI002FF2BD1B